MKLMQKTRLSTALALAIGGAVIAASAQTAAAPQNPNIANGGLQQAAAAAGTPDTTTPYVAHNALGQVLTMPYYTTRGDQRTTINIMNTSGDTLAVKATIREGKFSRDVLNFWILLSPYDTWTGFLSNSSGVPTLHRSTNEDTCVVGAFGRQVGNVFTAMAATTETLKSDALVDTNDTDTLQEGYISFVAAGKVDTAYVRQTNVAGNLTNVNVGADFAAAVKHNNVTGVPADCQAVAAPFTRAPGPITDITTRSNLRGNPDLANLFLGLAPGENPLKGNMAILDADDGIAGGTQMTAIANFNQDLAVLPPIGVGNGGVAPNNGSIVAVRSLEVRQDLVTAQVHPYFYEPSIASGDGICSATGITKVEDALRANSLINEWSQFANTGAETDWVVTFPSKGFRTDPSGTNPFALGFCRGTSFNLTTPTSYDGNGRPADSSTNPPTFRSGRSNGLPIYYTLGAVDREEKRPIAAPVPSPSPFGQPAFPWEVNVLTFKPAGQQGPLASNLASNVDLAGIINGTPNGWAELKFTRGITAATPPTGRRLANQAGLAGLNNSTWDVAALGFAYKVRKQPGSASTNFGQIIDHSAIQASIGPVSP